MRGKRRDRDRHQGKRWRARRALRWLPVGLPNLALDRHFGGVENAHQGLAALELVALLWVPHGVGARRRSDARPCRPGRRLDISSFVHVAFGAFQSNLLTVALQFKNSERRCVGLIVERRWISGGSRREGGRRGLFLRSSSGRISLSDRTLLESRFRLWPGRPAPVEDRSRVSRRRRDSGRASGRTGGPDRRISPARRERQSICWVASKVAISRLV